MYSYLYTYILENKGLFHKPTFSGSNMNQSVCSMGLCQPPGFHFHVCFPRTNSVKQQIEHFLKGAAGPPGFFGAQNGCMETHRRQKTNGFHRKLMWCQLFQKRCVNLEDVWGQDVVDGLFFWNMLKHIGLFKNLPGWNSNARSCRCYMTFVLFSWSCFMDSAMVNHHETTISENTFYFSSPP